MWIIKWCRKEEILHTFYAVLPESHKVDSKGLLVMFRPPVLFTATTIQCLLKILKDDLSVHYPLMDPSRKSLMIYKRKSFPPFQKRRKSDHAKDIETGKILLIDWVAIVCEINKGIWFGHIWKMFYQFTKTFQEFELLLLQ